MNIAALIYQSEEDVTGMNAKFKSNSEDTSNVSQDDIVRAFNDGVEFFLSEDFKSLHLINVARIILFQKADILRRDISESDMFAEEIEILAFAVSQMQLGEKYRLDFRPPLLIAFYKGVRAAFTARSLLCELASKEGRRAMRRIRDRRRKSATVESFMNEASAKAA